MKSVLLHIALVVLSATGAAQGYAHLAAAPRESIDDVREALFLPHREAVAVMSFGYRIALSNILWFKTISYFGKHYADDQNYRWLAHMCDLVTTLNPRARHVYEFGATMLAWEADAPRESIAILTKAIENFPDDWKFYYLRGFNQMYFLKDEEAARNDFVAASKLPGAHPVVIRLAARKLGDLADPDTAIEFLREMLREPMDEHARRALEDKLRDLLMERSIGQPTGMKYG